MTNQDRPIKILVADDHAVVRQGVAALVDPRPEFELVGEAADGQEAVDLTLSLKPDVILMDLEMPKKDGIEAIYEIRREIPDSKILVLTSFSDDDKVLQAIRAGAMGYVLKVSQPYELLQAIQDVYLGELTLSPEVARTLLGSIVKIREPVEEVESLTSREVDVLRLVAKGMSNQEISKSLEISDGTVRTHVNHILAKLKLTNRTQAALYALREGLTSLYPD